MTTETFILNLFGLDIAVRGIYHPPEYGYAGFFEVLGASYEDKELDLYWFTNNQIGEMERAIEEQIQCS